MKQLGMRLRALREGIGLSQSKFADVIGSTQSSINRYENGQATPTVELLRKYADYFDVSMDYIFARCDDPHGKLYEAKPPVDANNPELRKFVEMCFDPESPMNEKLKEAMLKMLGGGEEMSNELTHNPGQFDEVIHIIDNARSRAMKAVNAELIQMYWEIGSYVSGRVKDGGWGKSVVADFSEFLQAHYPGTKGFSAQNIWRMKQFYETYCDNEKLSPLVREIPWTSNLLIMTGCKTDEAREFYLRLCIANRYTKRELDRQIGSMLYERTMISHEKHKNLLAGNGGLAALRDSYVFEFLDLEKPYKEKDLRHQIVSHLKDFILEFGHDFTFVGEEYRVQVGNTDFFIDLLFYNRALSCLVAIELKIDTFRPEHLGQLNFYLEVLDRDVKKPNENPSVGLVLCTGKDDTVVEYALSRSMSPTMVADYTLHLPDKTILQNKLRELTELALESGEGNEGDEE